VLATIFIDFIKKTHNNYLHGGKMMKIIGDYVLTDSVFADKINKAMKIFIVFAKTAEKYY
jgi:hypothetical protein